MPGRIDRIRNGPGTSMMREVGMKNGPWLVWIAFLVFTPGEVNGQSADALAAEVHSAEVAFARSMADRDLNAFRSHVADEAVFFGSGGALRGAETITAAWSRFFEDDEAPFSWEPATVEVLDSGTLALSTGPVRDPEGNLIGTFNSIWRRGSDGDWKVVFDKGCPVCDCEP